MKIYTRTGDTGETSLFRGGRVAKHNLRVEVYGALDELNSWIGFICSFSSDAEIIESLKRLQSKLHILCSDIAAVFEEDKSDLNVPRIKMEDVIELEDAIDRMDEDLPQLTHFILPGGSQISAALHVARTICRRGERRLTELIEQEGKVNPVALRYVNRLSDYLFTLARWANLRTGNEEIPWSPDEG